MILKPKSLKILEALAIFKFLNTNQLLRLNIAKHTTNFRVPINDLIFYNLIGKLSYGVDPKVWRLPNYYYLKPKGVNYLVEEHQLTPDRIKYPIGQSTLFFRDYFHRTHTLTFQIEMMLWVIDQWGVVKSFERYFDKVGSAKAKNLHSTIKLSFSDGGFFIPDAMGCYELKGEERIFIFEIYNGHNTKRVIKQLFKHKTSLQEGLPSQKLEKKIASRVMVLYESNEAMLSSISAFREETRFDGFRDYYLFNHLEALKANFDSWIHCDCSNAIL